MTDIRWARPQAVVRYRGTSIRSSWRAVIVLGTMSVMLVVLAVLSLGIGDYQISPSAVISVLTGQNRSFDQVVVLQWRMPRIVCAIVVGAALGMAGAIFQAMTRNPLGSPDIVGFNSGAYAGAVCAIAMFGTGFYVTAAGALVGGFVVAAAVFLLSRRDGRMQGFRLIVVGIALGAVMVSVSQWVIIKVDLRTAMSAEAWAQGTLNGADWVQAVPVIVCTVVIGALLATMGPTLSVLQMGDDAAGALGVNLERARAYYFILGIALVALAAAVAGPIAFVALAAPQIARRLTHSAGVSLTSSAVTGALLLLASDLIALWVFAPDELPVGTVTVCLGGAYLVYLLVTMARNAR